MRTLLELVLGPINAAMGALPLWSARVAVALLLILPAVAVWRLGRDWVLRGAPDRAEAGATSGSGRRCSSCPTS